MVKKTKIEFHPDGSKEVTSFVEKVDLSYQDLCKYKWSPRQVLMQLYDFQAWLMLNATNLHFGDYMEFCAKKQTILSADWFYTIKNRFKDTTDTNKTTNKIKAELEKIDLAVQHRKIELAQKGILRDAPVIFDLKAKHGWKDGSENAPAVSIQMAIQGLSADQLERKISGMLDKGTYSKRLEKAKAVAAEYREIANDGC